VPAPARADGPGLATVTITESGHDIALRGERVEIGRLGSCAIHVADANVSRRHSAIEPRPAGWTIVDLGSTNGTYVNGERIAEHVLAEGDVITVGASKMVFHAPRG
jgi:pSer/pThr/pTyr-binding forkhead associated (FHA) protein